ncbi:MAG: D-alanyl-D-alanine carboxypeptidase [Roseburia sp.]|nr:D-alanyl-D-alanine carboxypeptidase [Roseburia sp.]MCM1096586.1 D-alanyl-D-alanine carboxypeptidase [Ruminococcus flavefaciens]
MLKRLSHKLHRRFPAGVALLCSVCLFFCDSLFLSAEELSNEERLELQREMPVQTNEIVNWPVGPIVSADAAILMEADTGTILYAKNIHKKEYPASTTKLLTTLMATELCSLDEVVTFSHDAVFDNPPGSSGIAMDVGQTLTMEQCLNAILIRSANEVSFAVAEHITGTTDWSVFADLMNERAEELGCLNSHFVNPNGLPDENHYTTAYDLAMIGRAFFANEMLCRISLTRRLEIPASDTIPVTKIENSSMKIIPGGTYAYPYLVGCKTGYTEAARSCLVSCAERDGMKLICAVMRDEDPLQYEDTISLFDYGFSNFTKVNVAQTETKYTMSDIDLFYGGTDIFGSTRQLLTLSKDDYIVLPRTTSFEDVDSAISYDTETEDWVALIRYTYHGADIGSVRVSFTAGSDSTVFGEMEPMLSAEEKEDDSPVIYVNLVRILTAAAGILGALLLFLLIRIPLRNYSFSFGSRRAWKKDRKRRRR